MLHEAVLGKGIAGANVIDISRFSTLLSKLLVEDYLEKLRYAFIPSRKRRHRDREILRKYSSNSPSNC